MYYTKGFLAAQLCCVKSKFPATKGQSLEEVKERPSQVKARGGAPSVWREHPCGPAVALCCESAKSWYSWAGVWRRIASPRQVTASVWSPREGLSQGGGSPVLVGQALWA